MTKTRSMTENHDHDHDDASSMKRFKTCDNGGVAPWSNLDHDVLFVVMMKLGVVDYFVFNEVCKSWRSVALCNKKRFMESKQTMYIGIYADSYEKVYRLVDFEGRKLKTLIPYSADMPCVGLTCGYLVFYVKQNRGFCLLNPITKHQLHFPHFPLDVSRKGVPSTIKGILVFSPSMNGWVFVVLHMDKSTLWFCIASKGDWNSVPSTFPIHDILAFKGKIYTIDICCHVYEMRLNPEPKLTLLKIKNCTKKYMIPVFVSLGEKLYVVDRSPKDLSVVFELDFGKMEWVSSKEKNIEEYTFFNLKWDGGGIKQVPGPVEAYDVNGKATVVAPNIWK